MNTAIRFEKYRFKFIFCGKGEAGIIDSNGNQIAI